MSNYDNNRNDQNYNSYGSRDNNTYAQIMKIVSKANRNNKKK